MTPYKKTVIPAENVTEVLTEASARHLDFVIQENITAKEAVEFMKSSMQPRTFLDNVRAFYDGNDLEQRLTDGLCRYTGIPKQSVRRKVYNWMHNKNLPKDREELFCICFILELDESAADYLLKRLTGQGIHYRDTRELIYAYCLKYGLFYDHAQRLAEELLSRTDTEQRHKQDKPFTNAVRDKFQMLQNHNELLQFLLENKYSFGEYHNTAYRYFSEMLSLLTGEGETAYSLEKAADTYLRLNMPLNKRTSGFQDVQKLVKKHWPGSRSIKAMKNRTQDVTRKVLLLLYIVTGGVYQDSYEELDEEYVRPEEVLEYHCRSMNRMLGECGMARIDPRNAFDFLILYSVRPEGEAFMSDRMADIVAQLYEDV